MLLSGLLSEHLSVKSLSSFPYSAISSSVTTYPLFELGYSSYSVLVLLLPNKHSGCMKVRRKVTIKIHSEEAIMAS